MIVIYERIYCRFSVADMNLLIFGDEQIKHLEARSKYTPANRIIDDILGCLLPTYKHSCGNQISEEYQKKCLTFRISHAANDLSA